MTNICRKFNNNKQLVVACAFPAASVSIPNLNVPAGVIPQSPSGKEKQLKE